MRGSIGVHFMDRGQTRIFRWMTGLSMILHTGVLLLCPSLASLFPAPQHTPVVIVELTESPMPALPEENPVSWDAGDGSRAIRETPAPAAGKAPPGPLARTWLKKMDAGLAGLAETPVKRDLARAGMPVRRWEGDRAPGRGDFTPAAAPDSGVLSRHVSGLEEKIRRSGNPGGGAPRTTDFAAMFGGNGDSATEAVPAWLRNMIREKVLGYLPELEAAYSHAWRRNPGLKGRLMVRFRIGPAGSVQDASPGDSSLRDPEFVATILAKVRTWTFGSTAGQTVDVMYPLIFVEPSS